MAGSGATKTVISELAKRVPKNQMKQFKKFLELHAKYKARVDKYPEKLPRIDWDDYRMNVRIEAIKMVDEFEKKYEELNKVFDDRVNLDTSKYYVELEKQRAEVQAQVKEYIAESNKRIKSFEDELARLCNMKPYADMTMEEFINLRPEQAEFIPHMRKPLFWPHDPDEQVPGPVGMKMPVVEGSGGGDDTHPIKPSDFKGKTEKFEFNVGEQRKTKEEKAVNEPLQAPKSMSVKVEAQPKRSVAKKPQQVETESAPVEENIKYVDSEREKKHEITKASAEQVDEPKIHIDEPTPDGVKRRLDPCNLIKKLETKSEEISSSRDMAVKDRIAICTTSKPQKKSHTAKNSEAKPTKNTLEETVKKHELKLAEQKSNEKKPYKKADIQELPKEHKKPHPCDLVRKKTEIDVNVCKTANSKYPYKDEKKDACAFFDPCQVKFGAGVKNEVTIPEKVTKEKKSATTIQEEKLPKEEPKKPHPCDLVKKKAEGDKDVCKSGFGAGTESSQSKVTDSKKAKSKSVPKETKNTQVCSEAKKQKKLSEPDDKDTFKDHSNADVQNGDSCARTPYYNPFRSDEENKEKEEEACDECKEKDPCKADKHKPNTDYYNPFKDDKDCKEKK